MQVHMTVTNYRTPGDLEEFCRAVEQHPPQSPWSLSIINVDPSSADMAAGERWAQALDARHWWSGDNIGYGAGCNEGSCCAKWPADEHEGVLAFFNADVIPLPGSIDACVDGLFRQEDWGILGPRQIDTRRRFTHAGIFGTLVKPLHRDWKRPSGDLHTDVRDDAVTVSGSAFFIRRSVWDHLRCCPIYQLIAPEARGAFLPTPHYYEETWLSYHAHSHGWKRVYFGEATMVHHWHRASRVGGYAEQQLPVSQRMFRAACDKHGIPHD